MFFHSMLNSIVVLVGGECPCPGIKTSWTINKNFKTVNNSYFLPTRLLKTLELCATGLLDQARTLVVQV